MPSQWPLTFPRMSGFGFFHHAVCCFPVTCDSAIPGGWLLTGSNLARKLFSMQFRPEGILQARAGRDRERNEEQINGEENRRKDDGFPNV